MSAHFCVEVMLMTPALLLLFVRLKHRDDTSNETYYKQYFFFFFFFTGTGFVYPRAQSCAETAVASWDSTQSHLPRCKFDQVLADAVNETAR